MSIQAPTVAQHLRGTPEIMGELVVGENPPGGTNLITERSRI